VGARPGTESDPSPAEHVEVPEPCDRLVFLLVRAVTAFRHRAGTMRCAGQRSGVHRRIGRWEARLSDVVELLEEPRGHASYGDVRPIRFGDVGHVDGAGQVMMNGQDPRCASDRDASGQVDIKVAGRHFRPMQHCTPRQLAAAAGLTDAALIEVAPGVHVSIDRRVKPV